MRGNLISYIGVLYIKMQSSGENSSIVRHARYQKFIFLVATLRKLQGKAPLGCNLRKMVMQNSGNRGSQTEDRQKVPRMKGKEILRGQ